ncbi:MAG: glycosyltransferase family 2 protein [Acidobacteriota bacterium]
MKKLTIVIVNYNSADYLEKCLNAVFKETRQADYQVVVVDNASDDVSPAGLQSVFPWVDFLFNLTNVGFSRACNQAIRHCPAEFYLLLNPDVLLLDSAIDKTLRFLSSMPEAGIVGCRVKNPDGSLQLASRRSIPRPATALYRFLRLSFLFPGSPRLAGYNMTYLDENRDQEVEAVSGSFLMFRNDLLRDVGPLDEHFFLYGEDLDFCYRAGLKGWRIYYFSGAEVIHYKSCSSNRDPGASTFHYYNAMKIFYRKHYSSQANAIQNGLVLGGIHVLYLSKRFRQRFLGKIKVASEV